MSRFPIINSTNIHPLFIIRTIIKIMKVNQNKIKQIIFKKLKR